MPKITLIIRERYELNDPVLQQKLKMHGFVTSMVLDTIGSIVGEAREEQIKALEELDEVAGIER